MTWELVVSHILASHNSPTPFLVTQPTNEQILCASKHLNIKYNTAAAAAAELKFYELLMKTNDEVKKETWGEPTTGRNTADATKRFWLVM